MKNLAGTYRASSGNSYTCRELWGDLKLVQIGSPLTGSYKFSMNFDDCSPVSYSLPEADVDVTGEVSADGCALIFANDNEFLSFPPERRSELHHDAVLHLGGLDIYVLQLGDRNLFCCDSPNMQGLCLGVFKWVKQEQ